jgi:hypothetical protein
MIGITDKISAAIGLVVGLVLMFGLYSTINTVWLLPRAKTEGMNEYIARKAVEDLKAERERKKDDAELQGLSDYDLCVRALGRVPDCDIFVQPIREE